jgi:polyisoprenoid-binding protein YceI
MGLIVFLLSIPMLASGATYQIDPDHSSFQFKVRHMTVINVTGEFKKVKGIASMDENDLTGLKVEVTLDATSVNTDQAKHKTLDNGGLVVGDDVNISVEVELVRK